MLFVFTVVAICILHLNEAKQVNALVTIPQYDISSLFTEFEIWGVKPIEWYNTTEPIVEMNVVIDDTKIDLIKKSALKFVIKYPDIEPILKQEQDRLNNRTKWTSSQRPDIFFLEYRDWIEYEIFLEYLLLEYPDIVSRQFMGQTIQGRNIPIFTLSSTGEFDDSKPSLYIQAVVHAREWLANMATMYILNGLLEGFTNNDPEIVEILNNINIFIAPTINIDGYIYSWEVNRMWRKNRRNNGDGSFGVDLNRNYDGPVGTWCTVGSSHNPSSDSYCGTSPYSEPEVQAIQSFIFNMDGDNVNYNIGASVDMHTLGWYILIPYGYNWNIQVPQPYYDEYIQLSNDISDAIFDVNGVRYTATQRFGPTSGTMRDFPFSISYGMNDVNNKIFSFTWEGRGPGFDPDPVNIIPAGQEQLGGMLELARFVMNRGL